MNAIRIRTKVDQNHELILRNLPLPEGQNVEVIILNDEVQKITELSERFPLRGKTIRFDDPFGEATDETDWEAIR